MTSVFWNAHEILFTNYLGKDDAPYRKLMKTVANFTLNFLWPHRVHQILAPVDLLDLKEILERILDSVKTNAYFEAKDKLFYKKTVEALEELYRS